MVVTDRHLLPKGDLFQYSSCPHYFMEILIYVVYCAMFWWRHPVCNAIALFVLVNQVIAGHLAHQWYLETFPDYPKDRAPVIPFLHYERLTTPPTKKTQWHMDPMNCYLKIYKLNCQCRYAVKYMLMNSGLEQFILVKMKCFVFFIKG